MYKAVQTVIAENNSAWAGFPAFETAVQSLTDKITLLEQSGYNQAFATVGVSALRDAKREAAAVRFQAIASSITAFAVVSNRPELIEQMKISKWDLLQGPAVRMLQRLDLIIAKATENLGDLAPYAIDQTVLDELIATRDELNTLLTSPRQAIVSRKTTTAQLTVLSRDINNLIKLRIDNLMEMIKFEHPDFFAAYKNARVVVDLRSRHSGNEGDIPEEPDDGNPF